MKADEQQSIVSVQSHLYYVRVRPGLLHIFLLSLLSGLSSLPGVSTNAPRSVRSSFAD